MEKKFEKEVKKNQFFFAIVPRGPSVGSNDTAEKVHNDKVSKEIIEFMNEYKDIVAEDIPDGLPLVRSISHCMDLIPRASLPNKAPYILTPTENEELNKQVHELLQQGLIRESLSLGIVPNVLTPKKNGEWRMCIDSYAEDG